MSDKDPSDYEYLRDRAHEYACLRTKLREIVAEWRLQCPYAFASYREALGDCIRDITVLLDDVGPDEKARKG